MVFQCIKIREVPREVLKTVASGLGFQHLPRDLANVNVWKTMFDPCSLINHICEYVFWLLPSQKTCLYNVDPLKPHFYLVKLGFSGLFIIFLISAKNIGGSNEYPQSMFWAEIRKISDFLSENLHHVFFGGKNFQYIWILSLFS